MRLKTFKPTRAKKRCLPLLFLLSLSCVYTPTVLSQEIKDDQCIQYFTEIIEIQKMREMLRIGAEELTKRYELGEISREDLLVTLGVWQQTEEKLSQKVAKLFEITERAKCFDEKKLK